MCPRKNVNLGKWPTSVKPFYKSKKRYKQFLEEHIQALSSLQQLHYASNRYALLLIFQGMDAAGRTAPSGTSCLGSIRKAARFSVSSSQAPRNWNMIFCGARHVSLPERGRIGIFNRSYYEEVLIVRVHPEILRGQGIPDEFWTRRPFGRNDIAPSWTWKSISTVTAPASSSSFSIFRRTNSESDSSSASMSRTRTGNSASRTFTRESTGRIT